MGIKSWFKRDKPEPSELEKTINEVIPSVEADAHVEKRKQEKAERQLIECINIIDKRLRSDFMTDSEPRFGTSEVSIPHSVTNDKRVVEKAVKVFTDKGWRCVRKEYGSAMDCFKLDFKLGHHISLPTNRPSSFGSIMMCLLVIFALVILKDKI